MSFDETIFIVTDAISSLKKSKHSILRVHSCKKKKLKGDIPFKTTTKNHLKKETHKFGRDRNQYMNKT